MHWKQQESYYNQGTVAIFSVCMHGCSSAITSFSVTTQCCSVVALGFGMSNSISSTGTSIQHRHLFQMCVQQEAIQFRTPVSHTPQCICVFDDCAWSATMSCQAPVSQYKYHQYFPAGLWSSSPAAATTLLTVFSIEHTEKSAHADNMQTHSLACMPTQDQPPSSQYE